MALLHIVTKEDPVLRKQSREVATLDERTRRLIADMKETLEHSGGVGLAAVQVGVLKRIFIIDIGEGPIVFVNPEVVSTEGQREVSEGCLSCPDEWGITLRPEKATVRAMGEDGKIFTLEGVGLLAQAMIHENNHLDGKLFTDDAVRMLTQEELEKMS